MTERTRDPLTDVSGQLAGLDECPVDAHPDVLEGVHRAVVAELDALAGVGAANGSSTGRAAG